MNKSVFIDFMQNRFIQSSYEKTPFLPYYKHTMIFKYKPHAALSLGSLVRFNSIGEFTTNDPVLIEKLSKLPMIKVVVEKEIKEEVKEGVKEEEKTIAGIDEDNKDKEALNQSEPTTDAQSREILKELRKKLQEKTGQKTYH
jgi:hypothetical protein